MTLYSYRCMKCGELFDMRRKQPTPAPRCPDCGGESVKVFTPLVVQYKGKGFYTTDSRKAE